MAEAGWSRLAVGDPAGNGRAEPSRRRGLQVRPPRTGRDCCGVNPFRLVRDAGLTDRGEAEAGGRGAARGFPLMHSNLKVLFLGEKRVSPSAIWRN